MKSHFRNEEGLVVVAGKLLSAAITVKKNRLRVVLLTASFHAREKRMFR